MISCLRQGIVLMLPATVLNTEKFHGILSLFNSINLFDSDISIVQIFFFSIGESLKIGRYLPER